MRTTIFELENPTYHNVPDNYGFSKKWVSYQVPTLLAYAINHYRVDYNNPVSEFNHSFQDTVVEQEVRIYGIDELSTLQGSYRNPILHINYLGIKDYRKLFPLISNTGLCERTAMFMEEADKTFDEGAWMSFVMMAGAVVECMLFSLLNKTMESKDTFGKLLGDIKKTNLIGKNDECVIDEMVKARNLIHAGRFNESYVDRTLAMRCRMTLEHLIKIDWKYIKAEKEQSQPSNIVLNNKIKR